MKSPVAAVTGWLVVLGVLNEWGSETATSDYILASLAGLAAGGIAPAIGSFFWNLAAAPKRLADARADAERERADKLQARFDALAANNADAKRILRERLENGASVRGSILNAVRGGTPIAPHVPSIDTWIKTAEVELRNVAPEWVSFFTTDTGDFPQTPTIPLTMNDYTEAQMKINAAHLARFDRHIERLREIVYERL